MSALGPDGPPAPPPGSPPPAPTARRGLVLVAVVVVAVVVAGGVAVALTRGGGGGSAPCAFSELAVHLPPDADQLNGRDVARSRDRGFEDGPDLPPDTDTPPYEIIDWHSELTDPPPDGWSHEDVDCAVDNGSGDIRIGQGSFPDGAEVPAGVDGRIDGDLLLLSNVDLRPVQDLPDDTTTLLATLDAEEVLLFESDHPAAEDDRRGLEWRALGYAAGDGDGYDLVAVWVMEDEEEAIEAMGEIEAILDAGTSAIPATIEGDAADALRQDGPTIVLRAPLPDGLEAFGELYVRQDALFRFGYAIPE